VAAARGERRGLGSDVRRGVGPPRDRGVTLTPAASALAVPAEAAAAAAAAAAADTLWCRALDDADEDGRVRGLWRTRQSWCA